MTRDEHMQWAKARALEYLDRGDLPNAHALGGQLNGQPLGVEAVDGPATNMLVGHPFLLSIEWLDGEPPEPHLELARRFAIKARDRMREGEQLGEPPWWLPVDRKGRS